MKVPEIKITVIIILVIVVLFVAIRTYKNRKMKTKECNFLDSEEFDSPDEIGSGKKMQHSTLLMLCQARKIANVKFVINSGYRTVSHNKKVGGVTNSSHLKGYAVDISTPSGKNQITIIKALRKTGFKRFGVYNNFVHVDNDPTKTQFVAWGSKSEDINPFKLA